ncbi:MAG: lactate utilization protein [Pseudomonadota bacterium]
MTSARDQILGDIRRALGGEEAPGHAEAEARLAGHPRGLIPKRAQLPTAKQAELFAAQALAAAATVAEVGSPDEVPEAVASFLAGHNLPQQVKLTTDPYISGLPWDRQPTLETATGRAEDADLSSVTSAIAGVAETGTLMLASGPDRPTTLNFLPDNHIVILPKDQIVGTYEEGWDRLRQQGAMPRTVNFITGPSRTGDIEQTLQLGAHGPRRLHIILVDTPD